MRRQSRYRFGPLILTGSGKYLTWFLVGIFIGTVFVCCIWR